VSVSAWPYAALRHPTISQVGVGDLGQNYRKVKRYFPAVAAKYKCYSACLDLHPRRGGGDNAWVVLVCDFSG
jgi:hypothetical protein